LIAEADNNEALEKGNDRPKSADRTGTEQAVRSAGAIFAERYHLHVLRKPREVRFALRYVLLNHLKHGSSSARFDVFSSARAFDGWSVELVRTVEPVAIARTWLLTRGWKEKTEPISPNERPGKR